MNPFDRVEISNLNIDGELKLPTRRFKDKWLAFRNVTFKVHVDFAGVYAQGIEFNHCHFEKGIDLSAIQLAHDLIANKTEFGISITLAGARIGGDLKLLACEVQDALCASNLSVKGDADFGGLRVSGAVELMGSRIDGNLDLGALCPLDRDSSGRSPWRAHFRANANLSNVEISGNLTLTGLTICGDLMLDGSKVGGHVLAGAVKPIEQFIVKGKCHLYGVRVGGNILLYSADIGGGFHAVFTEVGGYFWARPGAETMPPVRLGSDEKGVSLDLSGSSCLGIAVEGAEIKGIVRAVTGGFGRMVFWPSVTPPQQVQPCQAAGIFLESIDIKADALFFGMLVRKDGIDDNFKMEHCTVAGDLVISSDGLWGWVQRTSEAASDQNSNDENCEEWIKRDGHLENRTEIGGTLDLTGTTVGRDLRLSAVNCGESILLDHMNVGGDLLMSGLSYAYHEKKYGEYTTDCKKLRLTGLHCDGDADLTGLVVKEGGVEGRHLTVKGDLRLSASKYDKALAAGKPLCADIEGDVKLRGASASVLSFSSDNFKRGHGELDLSDGEFRKVEVELDPQKQIRPHAIKFNNANVSRWEFRNASRTGDEAPLEERAQFLEKTEGAYASVEKYYREEGKFEPADRVFCAMMQASGQNMRARKPLSWPLLLFYWGTKYGTSPGRCAFAIGVLLLISVSVFSNAYNVAASPAFLLALYTQSGGSPATSLVPVLSESNPNHEAEKSPAKFPYPEVHPTEVSGSGWGWGDAIVLALRYNVPLADLFLDENWEAGRAETRLGIRAINYARSMTFVNWVLWPVFLITLTNYLFRRKG